MDVSIGHWPARRIFNLVRAVTHPYPGAFGFIDGRKVLRLDGENRGGSRKCAECPAPSSTTRADGSIEVAAGAGSVIVSRIQFEGGDEASPRELLGLRERRRH